MGRAINRQPAAMSHEKEATERRPINILLVTVGGEDASPSPLPELLRQTRSIQADVTPTHGLAEAIAWLAGGGFDTIVLDLSSDGETNLDFVPHQGDLYGRPYGRFLPIEESAHGS